MRPLPTLYDVVVCTNDLRQPQMGGVKNAMNNLLKSLKEGELVIQNYPRFNVGEELKRRVNLELQQKLDLSL